MHAQNPWEYLLKSVGNLWLLLLDNLMAVSGFLMTGLAALVVHKSVEKLQLWGVPSALIEGMEIFHADLWVIDALAVSWLSTTAVFRFCRQATRGWL